MAKIPLFPLSNALFPDGVLHLRVFEIRYLDMIRRCIAENAPFGVVVLLAGAEVRSPEGQETLASVGTLARINTWEAPMPALLQLRCVGTERFHLHATEQVKYGLWMGEAEPLADDPVLQIPPGLQRCADALGSLIAHWQREKIPTAQLPLAPPFRLDDGGWVANRWCELLPLPPAEKARLLGLIDPLARLTAVGELLDGLGNAPGTSH